MGRLVGHLPSLVHWCVICHYFHTKLHKPWNWREAAWMVKSATVSKETAEHSQSQWQKLLVKQAKQQHANAKETGIIKTDTANKHQKGINKHKKEQHLSLWTTRNVKRRKQFMQHTAIDYKFKGENNQLCYKSWTVLETLQWQRHLSLPRNACVSRISNDMWHCMTKGG